MKNLIFLLCFVSVIAFGQKTDGELNTQNNNTIFTATLTPTRVGNMFEQSILSKVNKRTPEFMDSLDITKIIRFYLSGSHPTATTYNLTLPNGSGTIARTSDLSGWLTGTLTGDVIIDRNSVGGSISFRSNGVSGYIMTLANSAFGVGLGGNFIGITHNQIDLSSQDALVAISTNTVPRMIFYNDGNIRMDLTSNATGDMFFRNNSRNLNRLPKGAEGTLLRAGASVPAYSTFTIPNTISALSTFVANSANVLTQITPSAGQSIRVNAGGTAWEAYTPGSGVSDGDKGDITVSGSGATWTIDTAAVTYAKIQNVAANSFLANATESDTTVQEIATNRIPLFSSAITGTPSSSTYLRGDGSWTPGAGLADALSSTYILPQYIYDNIPSLEIWFDQNNELHHNFTPTLPDVGNVVYIDSNAPDGGDGSIESPYNTIAAAGNFNNSSWNTYRLKRGSVFSVTATPGSISRSITIEDYGTGPKPIINTATNLSSWTSDGNLWYASNSLTSLNIGSVYDSTNLDSNGYPIALQLLSDSASVNSTPNSFFYDASTDVLYVRTFDSREPDGSIVTLLSSTTLRVVDLFTNSLSGTQHVLLKNISIHGANPLSIRGSSPLQFRVTMDSVEIGYAGNTNGLSALRDNTFLYITDCRAMYNKNDGYNYGSANQFFFEWNSIAWGSFTASGSNNGSTAHGDSKGLRVLGNYQGISGKQVQDINNSKTYSLRCFVSNSTATDIVHRASYASNSSTGNTEMWLVECLGDPSYNKFWNFNNSTMYIYDGDIGNLLTGSNRQDAGSILNVLDSSDVFFKGLKTGHYIIASSRNSIISGTAPSAGIGGSVGSTDNAILRADVGSGVVQSSPVTIDDTGSSDWGAGQAGSARIFRAQGSANDVGFTFIPKGINGFSISSTGSSITSDGLLKLSYNGSDTNGLMPMFTLTRNTTGTPQTGLGISVRKGLESSDATVFSDLFSERWVDLTDGDESSEIWMEIHAHGNSPSFLYANGSSGVLRTHMQTFTLGDGSSPGTTRTITTEGSEANIDLVVDLKGTGDFDVIGVGGSTINLNGKLRPYDVAGTSLSINTDAYVGMNVKSLNAAETNITIGKDVSVESVMIFTQWGDGTLNLLEGTDVDIVGKTSTLFKGDMIWLHLIEKSGGISYYIGR